MCKVLEVGRSGYYAWRKRGKSARSLENEVLLAEITEVFYTHHQIYGSPRITEVLEDRGIKVSRPRVARLMRGAHLCSRVARKFVPTTDSNHDLPICANVLNRQFEPGVPGYAWVSDITYIYTEEGWVYLTIFMDLADRKIIGWALSETMETQATLISAWNMACQNRKPTPGLIIHSDRGAQYASQEFRQQLSRYPQLIQSMSRKGNCWDNAPAEAFFKALKTEWIYGHTFNNSQEAKRSIFQYIEIFYNRIRKHSSLGFRSPDQFFNQIISHQVA